MESYQFPRFSRALRAFSNLGGPRKLKGPHANNYEEYKKWKLTELKDDFSWNYLKRELVKETDKTKDISKLLSQIRSIAMEIIGGDQSQAVTDDAAFYILLLFLNEPMVLQKHQNDLKLRFGAVTTKQTQTVHGYIKELAQLAGPEAVERLKATTNKKGQPPIAKIIPYKSSNLPERELILPDEVNKLKDLSKPIGVHVINNFSMSLDNLPRPLNNSVENKKNNKKTAIHRSWLEKKLKDSFENNAGSSLNINELEEGIVSILNSTRSTDELQNEMFDLLGFDRFDLIQDILAYRQEICTAALSKMDPVFAEASSSTSSSSTSNDRKGNNYCVQVTVQSEKEKQLFKQVRKDEKRIQKAVSRVIDSDEDEKNKFDPIALREKRIAALRAAQVEPILTKLPTTSSSQQSIIQERYPFVFDSQRDAQENAGFIAGTRLMLPENHKRTDNKMYEEIEIPISRIPPPAVGEKRIRIESLDKVGKIAFQGIKELNRIQSIVFDTAYNTNENLLISAPTGAGKTNVAMLAIVHQIRQFVENDVILKDKFKFVYVAPMKALATEMTKNFGERLGRLGLTVKELTGDMQLTKTEILNTQMLVTTPEKWDVVTRKGTGDVALTQLVKLLILDEVHLLHGDRGPVVEALVARTLRLVESSQSMIRIVGLSATLPNYIDISHFLRVNPYKGLFYFDSRFRPVPLSSTFIGVKAVNPMQQMKNMDQACYDKVVGMVKQGHQVMVFVHARNATVRTANVLREMAGQKNELGFFAAKDTAQAGLAIKAIQRAKSRPLADLFQYGFSIHHAGLLRSDRSLVEKYFAEGVIKVLVCTSTLAWGVNLPAHAVIIRGTEIYDSKHGSFIDLGILDVLQIFGRAGRPQFDTSGHGVIITSHNKLSHYLSLLTNQFPIESNFINCLVDNLNAEVTLGTISNLEEAVQWLSYSYLFVRMKLNPQVYGLNYGDIREDPNLVIKRQELITTAAKHLDKARMMRFCERTGDFAVTDLGRTASHFYLKHATVEIFNELLNPYMTEAEIFSMISQSEEFTQLKVRDDELDELNDLSLSSCHLPITGGSENIHGKVNILMQTFLSRGYVSSFSLQSDLSYINQNCVRIIRALFEIALRKNNPLLAGRCLLVSKMFEQQQWDFESPMRQYRMLKHEVIEKLENRNLTIYRIRDMDANEVGHLLRHPKMGQVVKQLAQEFPVIELDSSVQPITRTVLRIRLTITANFTWNDKIHGRSHEGYYIWVEDPDNNFIYHSEYFMMTRKQVFTHEPQELVMTIPVVEPLPAQYIVRAISDRWLQCEATIPLNFKHLILPETHPPHTTLLSLQPLPVSALNNSSFESLYKFSHFNPIQTQLFHRLLHTDGNVLLGAPTGSGKTIVAEIAMLRVFEKYPQSKVVYIAPLKALVRERMTDWTVRLHLIGKKVVELTGDVTPDARAIANSDVIVTTPEKWDGISRSWQTRSYVRSVALIVIDEIHLLGEDRGPVLEVIVSRTNFISSHTEKPLRIVGLSTALANARDLAEWLGIQGSGLYNFRPSVRPVPLEVHISGFPGKHYCPRMFTMNKPTYQAIRQHSPCQPCLVFVSSRRQTRLTALDLIAFLAAEDNPKQWMHLEENDLEQLLSGITDNNLKLCLAFGIGLHHAGLNDRDRRTVEELFLNQKIQILVATATLAWGVNLPAHLVVIKGTEYYDGKLRRYVDMPITDVLQMMGRAGRPQFDEHGVAVVLVHDQKKSFYKKFLYEPFPVESSLLGVLPDHFNAEIVAGTIGNKQLALDYLTWTYLFRRLLQNPTYYNLNSLEPSDVNNYLSQLVNNSLSELAESGCIGIEDDARTIYSTSSGRIASYYYINHKTVRYFTDSLSHDTTIDQCFEILSKAQEFSQIPVRHNEDLMNADLAKSCPIKADPLTMDSSHTKCLLLLQAHMSRLELPCSDYLTDTKSVLDQTIRVIQAMIDIAAEYGYITTTLRLQMMMQACIQARWPNRDSSLLTLPHMKEQYISTLLKPQFRNLPSLQRQCQNDDGFLNRTFISVLSGNEIHSCQRVLNNLPKLSVVLRLIVPSQKPIDVQQGSWLKVPINTEISLEVKLARENKLPDLKVHCPRFPRGAKEGWFLNLGNIEKRELVALKRVAGIRGNTPSSHQLTFYSPEKTGRLILTLYVTSDCYLGLDQQYDIHLEAQ